MKKSKVTILTSGGIDSTVCIAFYINQGFIVEGLFIDYGQPALLRERKAIKKIAKHYKITVHEVKWKGVIEKQSGLIIGRNAFFLLSALMESPPNTRIIALGIHKGTDYPDCSKLFYKRMQSVLDIYTKGTVQFGAPFIDFTKAEIWHLGKEYNVPFELTYSCEKGLKQPCGKCLSCKDLEKLNASA